ncbi:hypothetical protein [Variovorax paradoxus]|uniref:hypothetical protein n=1 Tax=Variovorax paradoxus TaxID=34073 RepID=UPI0029C6CE2E|nr:hypothetical protein RZE77_07600 [Variovorax paradoxus]
MGTISGKNKKNERRCTACCGGRIVERGRRTALICIKWRRRMLHFAAAARPGRPAGE